ncbi:unnamed protein product [Vicia faba]|uniref:Dienelactone hydrolase domain-containing protein n=1 Tax=Vicia faba TaxID=3906 RepID=A0AAV1APX7_VICFA|nr:unnamed protein product [Vicia faba]
MCVLVKSSGREDFYFDKEKYDHGHEAPNFRKLADKVAAADHGSDKGFEDAKLIIEAIKSEGVASVGVAGFCWGGKVVTELAKSKLIEAVVLLHPSFVSQDDINGVDIPISILGAKIDMCSPPELVKHFEEILTANSVVRFIFLSFVDISILYFFLIQVFVKMFSKVSHGWTVRYNPEDAEEAKAVEEAHQDLLDWLAEHLKWEIFVT